MSSEELDVDIAILHDQFYTLGGAERVAAEVARTFDAPIYAMRVDDDVPPADLEVHELATGAGKWVMNRHYLLQDAYQMLAWSHVEELYEYDLLIQTKMNPYWFVFNSDSQALLRYTHSTPRALYDQFRRRGGHWFTDGMKVFQRMLYQQVVPYADHWTCNSEVVQRRLQAYFGLDADDIQVVHPPVDVESFSPDLAETEDYLLHVGRLDINKRLDLLLEVADLVDTRVVVAGDGHLRDEVERKAPPNVELLGYISEDEKRRRYAEARATLFLAENEDFGIVPVESLASGTPVIGVDEGFTTYQVRDGETGYTCDRTVGGVLQALDRLDTDGLAWTETELAEWTGYHFGVDEFRRGMRSAVNRTLEKAEVTTPFREKPTSVTKRRLEEAMVEAADVSDTEAEPEPEPVERADGGDAQ